MQRIKDSMARCQEEAQWLSSNADPCSEKCCVDEGDEEREDVLTQSTELASLSNAHWLDELKPGWSDRFAAAFESVGIEDSSDFKHIDATVLEALSQELEKYGAKLYHMQRIRDSIACYQEEAQWLASSADSCSLTCSAGIGAEEGEDVLTQSMEPPSSSIASSDELEEAEDAKEGKAENVPGHPQAICREELSPVIDDSNDKADEHAMALSGIPSAICSEDLSPVLEDANEEVDKNATALLGVHSANCSQEIGLVSDAAKQETNDNVVGFGIPSASRSQEISVVLDDANEEPDKNAISRFDIPSVICPEWGPVTDDAKKETNENPIFRFGIPSAICSQELAPVLYDANRETNQKAIFSFGVPSANRPQELGPVLDDAKEETDKNATGALLATTLHAENAPQALVAKPVKSREKPMFCMVANLHGLSRIDRNGNRGFAQRKPKGLLQLCLAFLP
jgi:hypothetical protein